MRMNIPTNHTHTPTEYVHRKSPMVEAYQALESRIILGGDLDTELADRIRVFLDAFEGHEILREIRISIFDARFKSLPPVSSLWSKVLPVLSGESDIESLGVSA